MVVIPDRARSATAAATAGIAWPVIAPVSPRQRATYSTPSTSTSRAPEALARNSGNAPAPPGGGRGERGRAGPPGHPRPCAGGEQGAVGLVGGGLGLRVALDEAAL